MKAFPRDIDVQTVAVRHVGIESELAVGSDARTVPASLDTKIREHGLLQGIGWDGGGREFRTNPISCRSLYQVRGQKYLKEYYQHLKQDTTPVGSGGTHIHISILNTDHENMESNATAVAIAFFRQFQKISGRDTFWASRTADTNIEGLRARLDRFRQGSRRTYGCIKTMLSPTLHQTLEFRGPKGSNDCDEILAWVQFLENVVKVSNRKSVDGVKFSDLLKGDRISKYAESLTGWRKLTKKDLNATLDVKELA